MRNSPFQQTRFEVARPKRLSRDPFAADPIAVRDDIENPIELFPRVNARLALYGGDLIRQNHGGQ